MFDRVWALSTGLISAVVKIAAEQGVSLAKPLQEQLTHTGEQRQVFEKAYQVAVQSLGELSEPQRRLLNHTPFVDAVAVGLLAPSSVLDLRAAAVGWAGELPLEAAALKKFFRLLKNALTQDPYWGELLEDYQTLRDQPELDGQIDERQLLRGLRVEVSGDGAAAVDGSTALGARAVYLKDASGNLIHTGEGDIRQIHTAGGAYIEGQVSARRDFIAGDQYNYLGSPPASGETELKAYFRSLAAECGELPMGIIDEKFSGKDGLALKDVYIDLDVFGVRLEREKDLHLLRRELERPEEGKDNQRVALLKAITQPEMRRMVLLGAAGSGKTTFTNYLTYLLANAYAEGGSGGNLPRELHGLLPLRLVLRRAAGQIPLDEECGRAEMLWNALKADWTSRVEGGGEQGWKALKQKLYAGQCLVLLDGLDEVPEAGQRRACLLQAVADFLKGLPKTQRVVLTARPYAYADPQWQLKGCAIFNLAPLSPEQVARFVERWYLNVRASVNLNEIEATRRAAQLASAIAARAYLGDLASRPLLLTLMAALHSTGDDLPEDRADLYEKTVHLLLVRWQRGGAGSTIGLGEQALQVDLNFVRQALAELAYQTQKRQRGTDAQEGPGDIPFGELLAVFVRRLPKILPSDLTAYLENRAGLLVEREPGSYCFAHRSFQEYLAAFHLLDASVELSADLRKLVDEDAAWWREVILLAIGKVRQGSMVSALDLLRNALLPDELEQCPQPSAGDWRAAALGGLALTELRVRERQPDLAELARNLPRARKWLVALLEKNVLPARERVEAGNALAALGDPRFDPERCYLPREELLGFVRIPGGAFRMGSDPKRDSQAYEDERPQHTVKVSEFYIQRYPVTVAQFGAFVKQSGYTPLDPDCLEGIANHPVVNVTWNDTVAYCRWLEGWLREKGPEGLRRRLAEGGRVRLPGEAQWEKAARGEDGRIYPWGDRFDPERANTEESEIGGTGPVGSFAGGASPYGVLDMSGNVWEWTRSEYRDYPYDPRDGREQVQLSASRALRGGAFNYDRRYARCACRVDDNFYGNFGFRVVLVSPTFYL